MQRWVACAGNCQGGSDTVIGRLAEALIYLCSADDKAGRQCISAPPTSLFLSLMPPRKGQPFPPERRNCSHTFRGVLHFWLPSAPQRYNTLDFPTENRVPTGMLPAPIGNPEPKGFPLWIPLWGQLWCPDSQRESASKNFLLCGGNFSGCPIWK